MPVLGGWTADGRCFRCVQRRRYYPDEPTSWANGHLMLADGSELCNKERKPRSRQPGDMRRYRMQYESKPGVRAWRQANRRWRDLRTIYGITQSEWESLYVWQGGRCACCNRAEATDVDHCHNSGVIRGLLCGPCNRMLGQAGEDVARLQAGIDYLIRPEPLKAKALTLVREIAKA